MVTPRGQLLGSNTTQRRSVWIQAAFPPPGHRVVLETVASGEISYECRVKKDVAGRFEWVFAGPEATLRDRQGARSGRKFGPPATWESNTGSRIGGMQVA